MFSQYFHCYAIRHTHTRMSDGVLHVASWYSQLPFEANPVILLLAIMILVKESQHTAWVQRQISKDKDTFIATYQYNRELIVPVGASSDYIVALLQPQNCKVT